MNLLISKTVLCAVFFFNYILIILSFLILFPNKIIAQSNQHLVLNYIQEKYIDEVLVERLGGYLTYDFQSVKVVNEKPIYQITQVFENRMQIYYPKEAKAFEMSAQKPFDYPIVANLTPLMNQNYGLEELGFSIDSVFVRSDSTHTRWISAQQNQENPIQFDLIFVDEKLVYMKMNNKNATYTVNSFFNDYVAVGSYSLPKKIESTKKVNDRVSKEVFYFTHYSLINTSETLKPLIFSDTVQVKSYTY